MGAGCFIIRRSLAPVQECASGGMVSQAHGGVEVERENTCMTTEQQVQPLAERVRGRVIRPGDDEFEAARHIWNGMIDRRPSLIVRCAGAADVIAGVNLAREASLP